MTPELDQDRGQWTPVATLWLPLDVLVVANVIAELARDIAANGHTLVATTDEETPHVLRLGYYVRAG